MYTTEQAERVRSISRRDFLKLMAAGVGVLAASSVLEALAQGAGETISRPPQKEALPCLISPGGVPTGNNFSHIYKGTEFGPNGPAGQHNAQDFLPAIGKNPFAVVAVASGIVAGVDLNTPQSGGVLQFDLDFPAAPHGGRYRVLYAHMDSKNSTFLSFRPGQHIEQGQPVGVANGSGTFSDRVHLHLSVSFLAPYTDAQGNTGTREEYLDPMSLIGNACGPSVSGGLRGNMR